MANELTISASISFTKGGVTAALSRAGTTLTVSGTKYTRVVQSIGLTQQALELGDVGTPGYSLIVNLDATNFVKIRGASGGVDCIKLKPGEFCLFRNAGSAPFAIADTAICKIEHLLIED